MLAESDREAYGSPVRRAMLACGWGLVTVPVLAACGSSGAPAQQEGQRSATGSAGAAGAAVRAELQPPAGSRPVNLLTATPAVVAVSSTVTNREIVPAHLVDGDLGTAWNSRTGELQGAWIGARVPADARVTSIRMTVGFTKVDPKLGDLFTMNPRIRKVRVLRNGVPIAERTLDPAVRTLQDIPIDQPGGEYKIEVVDILPGTKPSWRESCVSELEVLGMPGPGTSSKPGAPVVHVGSFNPPPAIAPADCVAAMFPAAKGDSVVLQNGPELISNVEVIGLTDALAVCRVEHTRERTERWEALDGVTEATLADTTIELAPVARPRLTAGERVVAATNTVLRDIKFPPGSNGLGSVDHKDHTVALSVWPLTVAEKALLVEVTDRQAGFQLSNERTAATLYRVSATGLTELLSYESTSRVDYEASISRSDRCRLTPPTPQTFVAPLLVLTCVDTEQPTQGAGRSTTTPRLVRYSWNGSRYHQQ